MKELPLKITVRGTQEKIQRIQLHESPKLSIEFVGECSDSIKQEFSIWLEAYLKGDHKPLSHLLNLSIFPPFTTDVLNTLCKIPFGTTLTYKDLAKRVNRERAIRAVGTQCGRNLFPLVIPCHRIIRSDGALGGFAEGLNVKKTLLQFESH